MDDILEKITINIDSDYATFIDESEFYVDIIDDIKNCIYIKTLKTEIFVKPDPEVSSVQYTEPSIFDSGTDNIKRHVFNIGDYLYVSLNDIKRVNTIAKTTTIMTFNDIKTDVIIGKDKDNNNIYDSDFLSTHAWTMQLYGSGVDQRRTPPDGADTKKLHGRIE